MGKIKSSVIVLLVVVCIIALMGIMTISLDAAGSTSFSTVDEGKWAYVCCGVHCAGGDICHGTGSYTCCK